MINGPDLSTVVIILDLIALGIGTLAVILLVIVSVILRRK